MSKNNFIVTIQCDPVLNRLTVKSITSTCRVTHTTVDNTTAYKTFHFNLKRFIGDNHNTYYIFYFLNIRNGFRSLFLKSALVIDVII